MPQTVSPHVIVVDSRGFVSVDGVPIGLLTSDGSRIRIVDRDRKRSEERGTKFVEVSLKDLGKLAESK